MNRNVWLLSLCQALLMTGNILLISVIGLIGKQIAPSVSMITLPVALQFLGLMAATIPASLISGKLGRKRGFSIGNVVGITGASLATYALSQQHFYLFCFATFLLGIGIGFGTLYRFAAIEVCDENARHRAISISMAGGVLAAVLGPNLAIMSQQWSQDGLYIGAFAALIGLNILALLILQTIQFPKVSFNSQAPKADPLSVIVKAPNFIGAVFAAMVAYAVMNILMTATPLAMIGCGFDFTKAAGVIEWHVLGMFVPAFFTGSLIEKFGSRMMILAGGVLFVVCIAINIHGESIWHFRAALVVLGVGWNFMFIAATGLFSQSYQSQNKAKAQAFNEFVVFSCVTVTALLSGWLESTAGWQNLNIYVLPFVLAVILLFAFSARKSRIQKQPV
ncbi:putative Permease of the major facilitator superfamily [Vibrio crassostreae]|uniref:Putative Permease of the major facilitator superfamily n=2 Tax=Vibrio crassostreae TaxID=246167 RepID=A0A822MTS9_9VIBR|nr:MFS transporter [Vibrio crassostreae]MDH5949744.1 MFS transporter [Vibrio crassostreae]TCN07540.1 putative MFS family arabinose efflux permease [Vibrio crassostreae]TCU08607.1 putative MFS family arabinose efflux permease [Vibrio crassostreae]CAK1751136.1 putative Permease of the major facilitator superfamily [Vibrio crassostreae]CAK2160509.1 putative Permease of the major facilitator superfamily [Vibrio crassostreae]